MAYPIVGAEAVASGQLNRHQLRTRHRPVFPGIYLANAVEATLTMRTWAAWLWSGRDGVICGPAAAAMLGAK